MRLLLAFLATGSGCADLALPSSTCDEVRTEALAPSLAAVDAHQSCSVDEDCETVWLVADCFDACSRVVGVGGVAAVEAAIADANAGTCADDPGCEVVHPPCVPPAATSCVDSLCMEL